jgi:uncharacterized RDD family membrane protein YckC
MTQRQRDRSLGDGVYFKSDDYVGLGPRIVILIVDTLVLVAIVWVIAFAWMGFIGDYIGGFSGIIALVVWIYSVPLKRSKLRTIGYRLAGAKLVTLKGKRPSLFMLTLRSLLWMFGPWSLFFDWIWCGIDDDRQTIRDRFTSMCLVRNHASPIGSGEIHLAYFNAFGYSLAYPHVVHPKMPTP